jgi:cytochrome c oxidase subunit 3
MNTTVSKIDELRTDAWSGGKSPFAVEYGKLMMWFFLLSDAFTFSAFLIYYGAQRFSKISWPDPDVVFQSIPGITDHGYPLVFVGIMTFILIMSSVTMVLAVEAGHRNSKKEVVWWMIGTIIGGMMFLGCQALEWSQFANLFFTITGFHGFHVFTGVLINIIILFMVLANVFQKSGSYLMVEKVGLYWHFVDLVWVFVFTFFYLV